MIYLDVTKTAAAAHASGLTRVTRRLQLELGPAALPVRWDQWDRRLAPGDWFLTAELFSEEERPGVDALLAGEGKVAAIYHDSIPLKHPHITWPQSVARHPRYLKWLSRVHHVFAVSEASRRELEGFWRWQGVDRTPPVAVLALGADFDEQPRMPATPLPSGARLLCVGIVEPRKNQAFLLDVAVRLWDAGVRFDLDLVGRVNPHFGRPIRGRIRQLARRYPGLHYHGPVDDATLAGLYRSARATLFPTRAEGCGLPLLESLWRGVPCVCSDLPVLRENADDGGCVSVTLQDHAAWEAALRRILADDTWATELRTEAATRTLPTWSETAGQIVAALG